jgi:chromosome segregation ATPase
VQSYVKEQENSLEGLRERLRDSERSMGQQIEQNRILDAHIDKMKQEAIDMKRNLMSQNDRISQMDHEL